MSNQELFEEVTKIFRKMLLFVSMVVASLVLTLVILATVFVLTWAVSAGNLSSPVVVFFLDFVDYESIVIFALSLIATIRYAPAALERIDKDNGPKENPPS